MPARRHVVVGLGLALGACNFRPMLLTMGAENVAVREELAAIEIQGLDGRLGYLVRNALLDELNPTAAAVPERYILSVRLSARATELGIQLDATITRYNLTVNAAFSLREKDTGNVLLNSVVRRISSYNVSREPYADLIASQTAERRAAELVSADIGMQLGAYFARREPIT
jgi:LPS-assembly lipoprotein